MGEEPNLGLEQLAERVAEQIVFIIGSAPTDPKAAAMRLLRLYLEQAQDQEYDEAVREQPLEEHDQQN
jgi:hypothetical protein